MGTAPPALQVAWAASQAVHDDIVASDLRDVAARSPVADDRAASDLALIGEGRSAQVFRLHTKAGRPVAIKAPRRYPRPLQLAHNEAAILQGLRHPNIIRLLAVLQDEDGALVLLEELGETDLKRFVHGDRGRNELSWRVFVRMAHDLAESIAFLHDHGIVHQDVKPQNVLVSRDRSLKLCDFGSATRRATDGPSPSPACGRSDGTGVGTLPYSAPELFGTDDYSPNVDVYSAGVCMWEMLTGTDPLFGQSAAVQLVLSREGQLYECPMQCMDGSTVPVAFAPLLTRCVEVDRLRRISARTLLDQLQRQFPILAQDG